VIGFLPVFFFLLRKGVTIDLNLIVSIAFSPVLIALINTVNVLLGIQDTILQYLLPVLLTGYSAFFPPFWKKYYSGKEFYEAAKTIIIGTIVGFIYWYIFFYPYYKDGSIYTDAMWNLGIVNELRDHFPPVNSQWATSGYFLYHYLANMGFAGFSNFSDMNIIQTVLKCGNLINTLSIFIILSLSFKTKIIENLFFSLVLIFISFTTGWLVYLSLGAHLYGYAISTYYWSLPVLFSSVYVIHYLNQRRFVEKGITLRIICYAIIVIATGFTKVSNLLVLVGIEFGYFIGFAFRNKVYRIWQIQRIFKLKKQIFSFLIIPAVSFFILFIFSQKGDGGLVPGIEIKDFLIFESWNPVYPIIAIYGPLLIFIFLNKSEISAFRWEFLFCGFLNLLVYFTTRHPGSSDLYFAFNTIICNILFITYSSLTQKFKPFILSYVICGIIILILSDFGYFKGFTPFEFSLNSKRHVSYTNYNFKNDEVVELLSLSEKIPKNALIAAPKQEFEYNFIYSSFLGRRIWNETPRYSSRVYSDNSLVEDFYRKQGFIPSFLGNIPKIEDHDLAYKKYLDTLKPGSFDYLENPEERYTVYQKCVFDNLPLSEYEEMIKKAGLTHIIVAGSQIQRINSWLNTKKRINGKYITIFEVSIIK
jgi:hypothetical protein